MSKYFDETLKLNNLAATSILSNWSSADSLSEETCQGSDLAAKDGQRLTIALSAAIRQQFTGCDPLGTFQESFRVLRTRLLRLQSQRELHSVVVTSSTKGEGKSAVSLNLAFSCAQLPELKVLLIDSDIRSCGLSKLLDAPAGLGLSEVLLQKSELADAILTTDVPNLHFLPCYSTPIPAGELLASRQWTDLIRTCAENYSLIIVDAPPILNLTDADLIAAPCDGVVMVVRSQQTRADFLHRAITQIDAKKLVGIILNGAEGDRDTYTYGYANANGAASTLSPIAMRLFGRNGSDKRRNNRSVAEPEPAGPPASAELPSDAIIAQSVNPSHEGAVNDGQVP